MSVYRALYRLPAFGSSPPAQRRLGAVRGITLKPYTFGRNVLKYVLLHDLSIRSQRFGREHMADLATRFLKANEIRGSYLEFGLYAAQRSRSFTRSDDMG